MSPTKSSAGKRHDQSRGNTYRRYKEATRAFCTELDRLVPFRLVSVSDLAKAADHVLLANQHSDHRSKTVHHQEQQRDDDNNNQMLLLQHLKRSLLTPLNETIRLRKTVGATYSLEEQDDGHAYMIQVLQYCRSVLRVVRGNLVSSARQQRSRVIRTHNSNAENEDHYNNSTGSAFELLNIDDDDDDSGDDDDDELCLKEKSPPGRPAGSSKEYSIESDLIEGSWVFQANLFFLTAENLFSIVAQAYDTLQQDLSALASSSGKPFAEVNHETVVHLLKATASVNLAIEHVRCLEQSFCLGREPFYNIYFLLAVLIFPDLIKKLEGILGPSHMRQHRLDGVKMAAHALRLGFVGAHVCQYGLEDVVDQMFGKTCHRKGVRVDKERLDKIQNVCWTICMSVEVERFVIPSLPKKLRDSSICDRDFIFDLNLRDATNGSVLRKVEVIGREWLDKYGLLGGKSGMLYTFAKMEFFKCNPPSEAAFEAAATDADGISLDGTRQVVDTLLCPRLMPFLYIVDRVGLLQQLPYWRRSNVPLCSTIFHDFDDFEKKRGRGTQFAEAFSAHALVYGASVLSAGDHGKRIAVVSRLAMQKFESQLGEMKDTSYASHLQRIQPLLFTKLNVLHRLSSFQSQPRDSRGFIAAFWNPLIAGSVMLTLVCHSNMDKGYGKCDILMQTRFTLHLYNALRCRNFVQPIEFLDRLDRAVASDENIWPKPGKPVATGFLKRFLCVNGNSARIADKLVDFLRMDPVSDKERLGRLLAPYERKLLENHFIDPSQRDTLVRCTHLVTLRSRFGKGTGSATMSVAGAVSDLFKYAVGKDFPREEMAVNGELDEIVSACSQKSSLIREAIDAEHEILGMNWLKVGYLLDEFIQKIIEDLRLSPLVAALQLKMVNKAYHVEQEHDTSCQRFLAGMLLAEMVFRELEFDDSEKLCVNSHVVAKAMKKFFSNTSITSGATLF